MSEIVLSYPICKCSEAFEIVHYYNILCKESSAKIQDIEINTQCTNY